MIALIYCKHELVLTLHEQPFPRAGERISIKRETQKSYVVEDVRFIYRFLPSVAAHEATDHRVDIRVREEG